MFGCQECLGEGCSCFYVQEGGEGCERRRISLCTAEGRPFSVTEGVTLCAREGGPEVRKGKPVQQGEGFSW